MTTPTSNAASSPTRCDALVVGAGIAGLYQLHRLRELGLKVIGIEAGSDVGGTWYWNRYPGARLDSQSEVYQYWFSEALYKEWAVRERFSAQPDVEAWLQYVADKLELRKEFEFNTRVESARFDEPTQRWQVRTDTGHDFDTQFLVTCCGMLSAPLTDLFPGQKTFKGRVFHTARWPKENIDFSGKRVGVVGIGATGIQVIQTLAPEVAHMKVFVRTPQYTIRMKNPAYSDADRAKFNAHFDEMGEAVQNTFGGFHYNFDNGSWHDATPEQRQAVYERCWNEGSLRLWLAAYPEIFTEQAASDEISEFAREKLRAQLQYDPKLCDLLVPKDYGFGTHRVPLENGYLEAFLRPNVEAVDVKRNKIVEVVPEGVKLADGTVHEIDVLILATGFDAGTGALSRIDIQGRGGRKLAEDWGHDIRTTMGLQVHGYPNLFTVGAPLAPAAALCNMTTCLQQQAGWIADAIGYLREKGLKVMEPTAEKEAAWVQHHDDIANATLLTKTDSWYMGSNVPGKPRRLLSYAGGVNVYKQACEEVRAKGYEGFALA
jgi:acetone monooxygenase